MTVIWLCNNSPICKDKKGGGGWFSTMATTLSQKICDINLVYIFPTSDKKPTSGITVEGNTYYTFYQSKLSNPSKVNTKNTEYFKKIIAKTNPDIIHIWGTEFSHSLSMVYACEKLSCLNKVVVHIQGLCSSMGAEMCKGLPLYVRCLTTPRDVILGNVNRMKRQFVKRGKNEITVLKTIKNVIGRTSWDNAHVKYINPDIKYYFVGEVLRDCFYSECWDYDKCQKHRVFMSQASYPIKGLHFLLKALKTVLQYYPDTVVYIAGKSVTRYNEPLKSRLQISGYGLYIKKLIKKMNLKNNVVFVGTLNAEQMLSQYLKANIYILPSTVENSPNSLGEAMLVGVPSIAAYVGGIPDFISNNETGLLYTVDDTQMLSSAVLKLFESQELVAKITENARQAAIKRFDSEKIVDDLYKCYIDITNAQE